MSSRRSDQDGALDQRLDSRPDDHADAPAPAPGAGAAQNPRLSPIGWVRFAWRQLTSMRTALVLLLLLALAAVPGSLVPQRSSDPNGVVQFQAEHPELVDLYNALQLFDTYTSFWFSAIYLLLFISLIGCIIPRTAHHLKALRAAPPATPARLGRLVGHRVETSGADAERAIDVARQVLRKSGYRAQLYPQRGRLTVSAERGYLRETGNLVFHTALIGVLVAVGIGGGFTWNGQRVVVQGTSFTNAQISYDSFDPGRFFDDSQLSPYSVRLDDFDAKYQIDPKDLTPHPEDFTAHVSTRTPGGEWEQHDIKVNSPLEIGDTSIYLLGNGYAPEVTVRDPDGKVVGTFTTPFLPQNAQLDSLGVIKVPDGLAKQVGLRGYFYPDPVEVGDSGLLSSFSPTAGKNSILSLQVYTGDLKLDDGVPVNAYSLDTTDMTELVGPNSDSKGLRLEIGKAVDLPDGLGSVELTGWKRFVSLETHHDPSQAFVATFAVLAVLGLLTSLFIPRRRVWVTATDDGDGSRLEYAGLARGDDPRLEDAVASIAWQHLDRLGERPAWTVGREQGREHARERSEPGRGPDVG